MANPAPIPVTANSTFLGRRNLLRKQLTSPRAPKRSLDTRSSPLMVARTAAICFWLRPTDSSEKAGAKR